MSIPAGMIIERFGGKISLLIAFSLAFLGAGLSSYSRPTLSYNFPFRYRSGHGDATGDHIAFDA